MHALRHLLPTAVILQEFALPHPKQIPGPILANAFQNGPFLGRLDVPNPGVVMQDILLPALPGVLAHEDADQSALLRPGVPNREVAPPSAPSVLLPDGLAREDANIPLLPGGMFLALPDVPSPEIVSEGAPSALLPDELVPVDAWRSVLLRPGALSREAGLVSAPSALPPDGKAHEDAWRSVLPPPDAMGRVGVSHSVPFHARPTDPDPQDARADVRYRAQATLHPGPDLRHAVAADLAIKVLAPALPTPGVAMPGREVLGLQVCAEDDATARALPQGGYASAK